MIHIKDEIRGRKIMKRWDIVIDRYTIEDVTLEGYAPAEQI